MQNNTLTIIATSDAPTPRGHYSQAIVANGFVFVAGLLPVFPATGEVIGGNINSQAAQIFNNLDAILKEAGTGREKVVSLQLFLCDSNTWGDVNTACERYFGEHKPARTAVPILPLRNGAMLEINAVALA